jgi:hypothetical protein
MNLNPVVVEAFARWKELDQRRGARNTREGILLSDREESEYQSLSGQIEAQFNLRPWEGGICYSMWSRDRHPTLKDAEGLGAIPISERVLEIRQRLEKALENYEQDKH